MPAYMLIVWLLIGAFSGYIASRLMGGIRPFGLLGDLVLGIVGALLGGWILGLMQLGSGGIIGSVLTAIFGAAILIGAIRLIKKA